MSFETSWDETPSDISKKVSKTQIEATQQQTLALMNVMRHVFDAILDNKSVNIESIKRPSWIKELLPNTTRIEKKLDYIASSIIRKDFTGPIVKCLLDIDRDKENRQKESDDALLVVMKEMNANLIEIRDILKQ